MAEALAESGAAAAAPAALPTTDQFFGPRPPTAAAPAALPTTDEFFGGGPPAAGGTPPAVGSLSGPTMDELLASSNSTIGGILDAMGQGAKESWGTQPLGLAPETIAAWRHAGIFNDYEKGQTSLVREFNERLIRPAAMAADAMMRAVPAAIRAVSEPLVEAGVPADLTPEAAFEAFPLGHATGLPHGIPVAEAAPADLGAATEAATEALRPTGATSPTEQVGGLPPQMARAVDLGVVGKGEAGYQDLAAPGNVTIESIEAKPLGAPFRPAAAGDEETPATSGEEAEPAPAAPFDVHAAARQAAPDTMAEYDALSGRKDVFTRWIDELADTRAADPRAAAAQASIDTILDKVDGDEDRLTKAQGQRLEETRGDLATFLGTDTPDMAKVRGELQATNAKLMALAPAVHDAYRQAAEMAPEEPASAPTPAEAAPTGTETPPTPAPEAQAAAETTPAATPGPQTAPAAPAPPDAISAAVAPPAEAAAATPAPVTPLPVLNAAASEAPKPAEMPAESPLNTPAEPAAVVPAATPAIAEAPARPLPDGIAGDIAQQLTSAGRPQAEAEAAGSLVQSHYEARAERFAGAKGSPEDLYRADAPAVRAGRGVRAVEYAQRQQRELDQPAYHGSPYTFDKFTLDHIGKGEGAQAFGHGLYFAGNKAVAEYYREALGNTGKPFDAFDELLNANRGRDLTAEETKTTLRSGGLGTLADDPRAVEAARAILLRYDPAKAISGTDLQHYRYLNDQLETKGRLYHVELAPKPDEYLDWDKPLSEQSDHVRAAIEPLLSPDMRAKLAAGKTRLDTGRDIYHSLAEDAAARKTIAPEPEAPGTPAGWGSVTGGPLSPSGRLHDPAAASAALHDAGVRGIRYQDRGSRGTEAGSHNFVIFNADDIAIREMEQTQRGKIRLQTATARGAITLFKDADASTFIHETGHHWLEELMADAGDERAPAELRNDAATVRDWLGTQEGDVIPTRAHEKFARGFERYMMEGHAPSSALANVFAKFRDWLMRIYQNVDRLRSPINADIRGVFDRLVASKDEGSVVAPDREPAIAEPGAEPPGRELVDSVSRRPGANGAYEPVPKEPMRLVDFLKKNGGLKDNTFSRRINTSRGRAAARRNPTEIRWLAEHPRAKGLLRARTGMAHDDATLKAWEAGYMPDATGTERPTPDDLYSAIGEDLNSAPPRYSDRDASAVKAYRDALERNEATSRLGHTLGIDPSKYTKQEFEDLASEHMSLEDQAREIGSQEAAMDRDFADFERQAQERAEARGDAWEPDAEDATTPRTLEDLERAHDDEAGAAAAGPREGAALPGADGYRPGPEAAGEERAGSREPSAGPAGRAGAAPGETPAGPHAAFEPLDDGLVDKAGNIRLDNLNQPEDFDAALRDVAERNGGFMAARRGVITDGQLLELADAVGKDPAFLDRKKIGDAFNAEQILAARKLLVQSDGVVRAAMAKADDSGAPADVVALAKAIARHEMIAGKVAQATAEWGRAGRAFRSLAGWDGVRDLNQMLKENGGRSLSQLSEMAKLGKTLKTPAQMSKFIADTAGGKIKRAIVFYYVNALLSGPITHLRYSAGNAINAVFQPLVHTPLAAAYGSAREALGYDGRVAHPPGELAIGEDLPSRVYMAEAGAQMYGLGKGFRDGLGAGLEAWRTGVSPALPGERVREQFTGQGVNPIPGPIGRALGVPVRGVAAIHSFFKAIRYEQQIQALAVRDALSRGLEGAARDLQVAKLTDSPTDGMMANATAHALKELYMRPAEFNSFSAALVRASNRNVMAKILVPFMRIGTEITRNAFVEGTPLGLFNTEVRDNLLGRNGGAAADMQAAKMTAGVGLMAATAIAVAEGVMTGDGPTDPDKRRVWLLNHTPNTIQIGPLRIPYDHLGYLSMQMRFAANMAETASSWSGEDGGKLAVSFLEGMSRSVLDETFMRGIKDVLDAMYHPQENGMRFIQNFATNWLPYSVGAGQVARLIDPNRREAHGILEAAWNHVPVLSQGLFPQRDMFGEPIPSGGGIERYANDPTVKAMGALQVGVGQLERKIRGVPLTDQQYDDFSRIAGRYAKLKLDAMIQGGGAGFASMPAAERIKLIHGRIEEARESARSLVAAQSVGTGNDIWKLAADAKAAALKPAPPVP